MSCGKIVQVIGAVIDVEFPRDEKSAQSAVPNIYDALIVPSKNLTLEVQQQCFLHFIGADAIATALD